MKITEIQLKDEIERLKNQIKDIRSCLTIWKNTITVDKPNLLKSLLENINENK